MSQKASRRESYLVAQAKDILLKKVSRPNDSEILELTRRLKRERAFSYARKLLEMARESFDPENDAQLQLKFAQEQALCTYKDQDLPVSDRLDRALRILDAADALAETENQESLGLAGAIFKRKWEVTGHKIHLEHSLYYYLRGYQRGPTSDFGYTGINAAYVLDQLAGLEAGPAQGAGMTSNVADNRRIQANDIRAKLADALPGLADQDKSLNRNYWFLSTIAEAYFGLQDYDSAREWLKKAADLPYIPPWELESTARQLTSLVRNQLQDDQQQVESGARQTLEEFLGNQVQGLRTAFLGKVGLALSGGGFRASLFHIGVLAKLAELDMLDRKSVV